MGPVTQPLVADSEFQNFKPYNVSMRPHSSRILNIWRSNYNGSPNYLGFKSEKCFTVCPWLYSTKFDDVLLRNFWTFCQWVCTGLNAFCLSPRCVNENQEKHFRSEALHLHWMFACHLTEKKHQWGIQYLVRLLKSQVHKKAKLVEYGHGLPVPCIHSKKSHQTLVDKTS